MNLDEFGIAIRMTILNAQHMGLRLREITVNNSFFKAIAREIEERTMCRIDMDYLREHGSSFEGVPIKLCDYDERGGYIETYSPLYEI